MGKGGRISWDGDILGKQRSGTRMQAWLVWAGVNGCMAVAAGAIGAHAVADPKAAEWLEKAARYQMYHALALVGVAWLAATRPDWSVTAAGIAFLVGIALFSGTLYGLASGVLQSAGAAPAGGIALMIGWLLLVVAAFRG